MKQFVVYQAPGEGEFQAVKQGWSWPGCLFTTLWALVKKLWGIAAVLFGSGVFLSILMNMASSDKAFLFFLGMTLIGIPILVGSLGNKWREKNLVKRGYVRRAIIIAKTPGKAVMQCLNAPEGARHEAVHDLSARR